MKNRKFLLFLLSLLGAGTFSMAAAQQAGGVSIGLDSPYAEIPDDDGLIQVQMGKKIYHVADQTDSMQVYQQQANAKNCLLVISKQEFRLYVYECKDKDTLLVAHYPICYARNPGNKQRVGDMKTPESYPGKPFTISQIQPASSWKHDFKDGRGSLPSYGDWFLRLVTPGHSGIGIHGSTNNEASVPGRDSEGCIRLRDADIVHLKNHYAHIGMPVIIKSVKEGKLPFEKKAEKALGEQYVEPLKGYTLAKGVKFVSK